MLPAYGRACTPMATVSICKSGVRARDRGCSGTRLMAGSENLVLALRVWTGARRALRAQHHQVAAVAPGLVERSCPIRKTVSAVPPMDRRLAPFASEAADTNARFPILHGAINRLARQATEKDAQWSLVRHRSLFAKVAGAPIAGISRPGQLDEKAECNL